ncbi:uncharacterized protein LOC128245671 [Mya arenaria]|uniref:uncharacterized protein LOC128245671 n=1 Tax=Mya arenaria TaxID=6604 RepID=UPI0022E591F2|nr:uncharacterized protein LOC128245671 [Mya arenaria]XP_052819843.1 uncharacterized protein LOC128245671 [Mya arenaria]XP_052819844.1 uncharacterized protein LOC128245671 [Mya arenaria]XP_052819845.1 uncharacterized protein LOC128245671 [Mya arenaria]XP_052819846.1 uncharacterized protein LOC128245671 [Mya arenaria]XP_052819847.1 uncharacterized protein LOC128245671 [Mya arenaria]XP_052819848.1 uncharacterized protein LOC128245671 [Mya arenaria]
MYRPGMGVDPWYENFKFFLTYWLLSNNNRDRMGDADQLPPIPPGGHPQGPHPYLSPPQHKPNGGDQSTHNQSGGGQTSSAKSPSGAPPSSNGNNPPQINWDSIDKPPPHSAMDSPRQTQNGPPSLSESFNGNLGGFKHPMSHGGHHNNLPHPGNHIGHHGNGHGNGVLPEHIIVDKDRRHVCPHCYKGFRSRQQLNQHNLVHSGLRKYHCLYCERAFKQLSHLQQHHRIHTGEKPYRCPLDGCDKAFAQMSNLQHHMRQHDKTTFGQKQCMCPFCDRGYASEKSLKSHLSKMHPDSKFLGLGGQRSGLPLMEGQGHPMLGGPQAPMSHHNSLPMMHPGMKSPLTPPGGPLELTVNAHQRNNLGPEGRKYSLDSNKFPMNSDLPHDSKIFQRSLSERIPERSHDKLDSMLDQRFGFQNHFRDVNRFGDRSFEPFSPSRLHEAVRSFDFKDIEAKLFDPSMSGEKFQRMAENFNEFRSRFQDQMFRRDGSRQGGFLPDGRNMIQEMNDRNAFFNSRNENIDLSHRDRYEITRNFNSMNMNDVDGFGANRHDPLRMRSRNEMDSRNNMSSPDYNRGRESVSDNVNMSTGMERQIDIQRNGLNLDQNNMSVRNNSAQPEVMIPRSSDMSSHDNVSMSNSQRGNVLSGSERDLMAMRAGRMETSAENEMMGMRSGHRSSIDAAENDMMALRQQQSNGIEVSGESDLMGLRQGGSRSGLDSRNGSELMNMRSAHGNGMDTSNETEMMALRAPRTSMDMNVSNLRMMSSQIDRNDVRNNCNSMMSPNGNIILGGNARNNGNVPMDMVDRNGDRPDHGYENRMQSSEMQKSSSDFSMMDRGSLTINHDKDKIQRSEDVVMDSNINIGNIENDGNNIQRRIAMGNLCNDIDMAPGNQNYTEKGDVHSQSREMIIHENMNMPRSSSSMSQQIGHHGSGKENQQDRVMSDADIDFESRNEDKNSSSPTNLSDPNMIRQRKQRKPTNPQHVFMPTIDHYTSFAVDEVEECSALI